MLYSISFRLASSSLFVFQCLSNCTFRYLLYMITFRKDWATCFYTIIFFPTFILTLVVKIKFQPLYIHTFLTFQKIFNWTIYFIRGRWMKMLVLFLVNHWFTPWMKARRNVYHPKWNKVFPSKFPKDSKIEQTFM